MFVFVSDVVLRILALMLLHPCCLFLVFVVFWVSVFSLLFLSVSASFDSACFSYLALLDGRCCVCLAIVIGFYFACLLYTFFVLLGVLCHSRCSIMFFVIRVVRLWFAL